MHIGCGSERRPLADSLGVFRDLALRLALIDMTNMLYIIIFVAIDLLVHSSHHERYLGGTFRLRARNLNSASLRNSFKALTYYMQ